MALRKCRQLMRAVHPTAASLLRGLSCSTSSAGSVHADYSVNNVIKTATALLQEHDVPDASFNAREMVFHTIACRPVDRDTPTVNGSQLGHLSSLLHQRIAQQVPLQYVLGEWEFRDLTLAMKAPVLIPRPETEVLVSHINKQYRHHRTSRADCDPVSRFVEVGVGTGAISLSLLHENLRWEGVALDIDHRAIALATTNRDRFGLALRLQLRLMNACAPSFRTFLRQKLANQRMRVENNSQAAPLIVVSNPPYVTTQEMASLDPHVRDHESTLALDGGEDGLDVVRCLMHACAEAVASANKNGQQLAQTRKRRSCSNSSEIDLWLEVSPPQIQLIERLATNSSMPITAFRSFPDQYNKTRFAFITFCASQHLTNLLPWHPHMHACMQ